MPNHHTGLTGLIAQQSPLPYAAGQCRVSRPQQPPPGRYEIAPQQPITPDLKSSPTSSAAGSTAQGIPIQLGSEDVTRRWPLSSGHQAQHCRQLQLLSYDRQRGLLTSQAQRPQRHQQNDDYSERLSISFLLEEQQQLLQRSPVAKTQAGPPYKDNPALRLAMHQTNS